MKRKLIIVSWVFFAVVSLAKGQTEVKPETLTYTPFTWKSDPPKDNPFKLSTTLTGIKFLGKKSGFHYGDTWYPTWAANDT